ncbi:hypothetical protein HZC30_05115 [Candidatus Woesearchaeota archaeon]|nr:hypothetical protein [Candidatus Woesearchaeota archaeon]
MEQLVNLGQPVYVLPQSKKRTLIPKTLLLIVLGVIFYSGILLNIKLLSLTAEEDTMVKIIALGVLTIIVGIGIFLDYHQASQPHTFYQDRLMVEKKEHFYHAIEKVERQQNFWDKLFKTYSVDLGEGVVLRNISAAVPIEGYIQQLVAYAKGRQ